MTTPTELRARAAELESRVPPVAAGPRTDDERMWLEKAAALRAEADQMEPIVVNGPAISAGSLTIGDPSSAQTIEIAPWTPEETEHYHRTGVTPLERLHRENLVGQWNNGPDRDDEK